MKKTKIWASALFMAAFAAVNVTCAFGGVSETKGHLDSIVGDAIAGWVWDSSSPDSALEVTVTVKNQKTGEIASTQQITADESRDDLREKGIGTGNYGFHAKVVWSDLPDGIYTVSASAQGKAIANTLRHANGDAVEAAADASGMTSLGSFRTTAYCPCRKCSEGWGRRTSSGALATANHTVAVDPRVIPIGSRLMINGQEYVAEDIGGAVKGSHVDIYFNTHGETLRHGTRRAEVYLIR